MQISELLSGGGAFLAGSAAWAAYLSPRARTRRREQGVALDDQRRFHEDWAGTEARPGVDSKPGVMERLASYDERFDAIEKALQVPILNGDGMRALQKIDRLDRFRVTAGKRLRTVEQKVTALAGEQATRGDDAR